MTGYLQEEAAWREIQDWVEAAKVVAGMRSNRVGVLGHYYCGMLDVYSDMTQQAAAFGNHFQLLEMCELYELRQTVTPAETQAKIEEFHLKFEVSSECEKSELERAARKRFDETFASVSREFSRHFVDLFGGGSARLALAHESNGEEPGIDIIAQPPGKRPQSLSLLSGGERALTATALIFAILEVVPTPFSVLDEVDAALDDTNVERFCRALSNLSRRTQFIIITHNRGTMDAAETLYGISMSESNTSRVLSLRMPKTDHPQLESEQRT